MNLNFCSCKRKFVFSIRSMILLQISLIICKIHYHQIKYNNFYNMTVYFDIT